MLALLILAASNTAPPVAVACNPDRLTLPVLSLKERLAAVPLVLISLPLLAAMLTVPAIFWAEIPLPVGLVTLTVLLDTSTVPLTPLRVMPLVAELVLLRVL